MPNLPLTRKDCATNITEHIKALLCFLLFILATGANAAVGIAIDPQKPSYQLEPSALFFEDAGNSLTLKTISSPEFNKWRSSDDGTLSFGYTNSTYWVKFRLSNTQEKKLERLLEISYAVLDRINVYVLHNSQLTNQYHFGDQIPFKNRPIDHANFLVPLELPPGSDTDIYLKVKTSSSMQIPLTLWKNQALIERDQDHLISRGIYFGVMMIMALYNLMLFFVLRDKNFLYYVLYVTSMASLLFGISGLSFKYFWPTATTWNDQSIVISLAGIVIFGLLFTRSFCSYRKPGQH